VRSSATEEAALPSSTVGNGKPAAALDTLADRCDRDGKKACCVAEKDKVRERCGVGLLRDLSTVPASLDSSFAVAAAAFPESNVPTDLAEWCVRRVCVDSAVVAKSTTWTAG
jgi:hypothetical protein